MSLACRSTLGNGVGRWLQRYTVCYNVGVYYLLFSNNRLFETTIFSTVSKIIVENVGGSAQLIYNNEKVTVDPLL